MTNNEELSVRSFLKTRNNNEEGNQTNTEDDNNNNEKVSSMKERMHQIISDKELWKGEKLNKIQNTSAVASLLDPHRKLKDCGHLVYISWQIRQLFLPPVYLNHYFSWKLLLYIGNKKMLMRRLWWPKIRHQNSESLNLTENFKTYI